MLTDDSDKVFYGNYALDFKPTLLDDQGEAGLQFNALCLLGSDDVVPRYFTWVGQSSQAWHDFAQLINQYFWCALVHEAALQFDNRSERSLAGYLYASCCPTTLGGGWRGLGWRSIGQANWQYQLESLFPGLNITFSQAKGMWVTRERPSYLGDRQSALLGDSLCLGEQVLVHDLQQIVQLDFYQLKIYTENWCNRKRRAVLINTIRWLLPQWLSVTIHVRAHMSQWARLDGSHALGWSAGLGFMRFGYQEQRLVCQ